MSEEPRERTDVLERILRCPKCGGSLQRSASLWRCPGDTCPAGKPGFEDALGQPILFADDTGMFRAADVAEASRSATLNRRQLRQGWAFRVYKRLTPGNDKLAERNAVKFSELVSATCPSPVVLVVGGGTLGGGTAPFRTDHRIDVVSFDVYASPHTDFVADAHHMPIASKSVDGVWLQAVLEHVLDPHRVVSETVRVLKPGGVVYSETPFMQQVHEGPFDFTRFTHSGHRWLFREFEEIASGPIGGAGTGVAWSARYFGRAVFGSDTLGRLVGIMASWLALLDRIGSRRRHLDAAVGCFFLGCRAGEPMHPRALIEYYASQ